EIGGDPLRIDGEADELLLLRDRDELARDHAPLSIPGVENLLVDVEYNGRRRIGAETSRRKAAPHIGAQLHGFQGIVLDLDADGPERFGHLFIGDASLPYVQENAVVPLEPCAGEGMREQVVVLPRAVGFQELAEGAPVTIQEAAHLERVAD